MAKTLSLGIATTLLATTSAAGSDTSDRAPVVYVIPFSGQMGTDIHPDIYEDVIKDANEVNPDLVIFRLDSADIDNNFHIANDDRREAGLWQELEAYRDMMMDLQNKLPVDRSKQIMWIEDSVGASSLLALSWPTIYMSEGGRLWGIDAIRGFAEGWQDPDVRAKMYAAWVGIATGFPQAGGFPMELSNAMIEPQHDLGVKFKGREVQFSNDLQGTVWTIDSSDKSVARFDADSAEQVMLSRGTVQNLDDLMFLLGYREYGTADSGEKLVDDYKETWRRTFERCASWLKDARDRQSGGTLADLGAAKNALEKVLKAGQRYPAVAARLRQDYGIDLFQLETQIEAMKRQIAEGRRSGRNRRGGGGSGRGGGGLGP
ncbi:MAG: hypothetical protein CMJ34_13785 [Phycisphaerae bacterium]|nr:hypothetical protein [Phycisphaerae bacterium]